MSVPFITSPPGFGQTPGTAQADTAITGLVPPFPGARSAPLLYGPVAVAVGQPPVSPVPNWYQEPYTHLTAVIYTTDVTAHTVTVLRPLNFTTFRTAVAKNATTIYLSTDPGLYSTSYNYALPGSSSAPAVADNAIDVADWVAFQTADGLWHLDTIASGAFATDDLVLTTGTPNYTYGTVMAGSPLFFFGVAADVDPATGIAHPSYLTVASAKKANLLSGRESGGILGLHPGDPLLVVADNITNAGVLDFVGGFYNRF